MVAFSIGITYLLFYLGNFLLAKDGVLYLACSAVVYTAAVVFAIAVFGVVVVSMIDWMRSTTHPHFAPPTVPVTVRVPIEAAVKLAKARETERHDEKEMPRHLAGQH